MKILIAASAVAALVALPAFAGAQELHHSAKSPKTDLHVSSSIVVGTQTLTQGDYQIQCVDIDGTQYLVVKSDDGDEIARVPCEPEALPGKITQSEFRSVSRDGRVYLTAVRIKGETVAHRVVPNPAG